MMIPIVAIIPREAPKLLPDLPSPISIEHTLKKCPECDTECWIGPAQQRLLDSSPRAKALCYWCIFKQGLGDARVVGLDPNADSKPRRTL